MEIPNRIRQLVRERANGRCEYCQALQVDEPFFTFQIEHVIARQHGGSDDPENLALACPTCNAFKGPNIATVSPVSGKIIPLFHPRQQAWDDHFVLGHNGVIVGKSETGIATALLLNMNDSIRVAIRRKEN